MKLLPQRRPLVLPALAVLMLATRACHFGPIPDASWAIFFLAGLYLAGAASFGILFGLAVAIDYLMTQQFGVSSYCISPAYPFLLPAYAGLWAAGAWLRRSRRDLRLRDAGWVGLALLLSVSVCFLLTDASFYWLSGQTAEPTASGWMANAWQWYPSFLWAPFVYVALAGIVQAVGAVLFKTRDVARAALR